MEKTFNHRMVFITTKSFENAKHISKILVTEKLAACCSIIQNAISIFSWQNVVQERREYLVLIKTIEEKLPELEERIIQLHSDEVPEILSFSVSEGLESYLNWVNQVMSD
jgi:periplasmic divalent cation tolerance protein